jgi:hypothetical protein
MKKYYTESRRKGNVLHTARRKSDWIGHIFVRKCLLKHFNEVKTEGRIEVTEDEKEDVSIYWMNSGKEMILKIESGSNRSHFVENSLWKRMWKCRDRL